MWVKLDEEFPDHIKLATLGVYMPVCGWLFVCGLAFCNRQLTDGRIPKVKIFSLTSFVGLELDLGHAVKGRLCAPGHPVEVQELAERLVWCGLWEDDGADYVVHDYLDYQPSREAVLAERAARVAAGRLGAAARWHKGNGDGKPIAPAMAGAMAPPMAKRCPVPVPVLPPTEVITRAGEPRGFSPSGKTGKPKHQPRTTGAWRCPHTPMCSKTDDCIALSIAEAKRGKA